MLLQAFYGLTELIPVPNERLVQDVPHSNGHYVLEFCNIILKKTFLPSALSTKSRPL